MKVNIAVNGTFRYPQYARYYDKHVDLGRYYLSHRMGTNAASLGLRRDQVSNFWLKEYLLHLALRVRPPQHVTDYMRVFGTIWQDHVIRNWSDCDTVEVVTGELADRVLAFAAARGVRTLAHPVNSHPLAFTTIMNRAYEDLGLRGTEPTLSEAQSTEMRCSDRFIVDSEFVRRTYVESGVDADKVSIIRPGNDLARFSPRSDKEIDRDVFRVVSVGAVSARKGHRYLLKTWKRLRLPRAELIIIGASQKETGLIFEGFTDIFRYLDRVPNENLREILVSASLFVLPSVEDGFAQAPIEALSCGVPVIVTDNNGMADVVQHGHNGFIVPAFDSDQLGKHIEELYLDRERAVWMGRNAAVIAQESFSWDTYVEDVAKQHRVLLGED